MEMLRERGNFIRPQDAVDLIKRKKNIRIGPGKPGRETSDLSAALGHGRIPGLVVTRALGWGLSDWNGVAPGKPQKAADTTPAEEGPRDPDMEHENWHMSRFEAEAEAIAKHEAAESPNGEEE